MYGAIGMIPLVGESSWSPGSDQLSGREREVLGLVADGLTSGQIAEVTGLSRYTVDGYVASACTKLGAPTRWAAALLLDGSVSSHGASADVVELDPVHLELLDVLATGASVAEAARRVHVSTRSAYRRVSELRSLLGARSRTHAVRRARRQGLLTSSALVVSDGMAS